MKELQNKSKQEQTTKIEISLADERFFKLSIGTRVLKKEVFQSKGDIPLYSANVHEPFGHLNKTNDSITDFKHNYVLWGIDGNFELAVKHKGEKFAITDHCGAVEVLDPTIIPEYLGYQLEIQKYERGFDRSLRASLANMKEVIVSIPTLPNGCFDIESQQATVKKYMFLKEMREDIQSQIRI